MIAEITHQGRTWRIALNKPIDLSLPLDANSAGPRAWHVGPPTFTPVQDGDKTYAVAAGAPVNFRDVAFNPHGHGTHTDSVRLLYTSDASAHPTRVRLGRRRILKKKKKTKLA